MKQAQEWEQSTPCTCSWVFVTTFPEAGKKKVSGRFTYLNIPPLSTTSILPDLSLNSDLLALFPCWVHYQAAFAALPTLFMFTMIVPREKFHRNGQNATLGSFPAFDNSFLESSPSAGQALSKEATNSTLEHFLPLLLSQIMSCDNHACFTQQKQANLQEISLQWTPCYLPKGGDLWVNGLNKS